MEEVLHQIREFADGAHGGQQRKYSPERYIEHPARVMNTCKRYSASFPMLAAALLHDVLEDTSVTAIELKSYLQSVMNEQDASQTLRLVMELTDIYTKASHPRLNRKRRKAKEAERIAAASADAQTIKYADIIDNCTAISGQDSDFAPVFLRECKTLLHKMAKGNQELRQEAERIIKTKLDQLHLAR